MHVGLLCVWWREEGTHVGLLCVFVVRSPPMAMPNRQRGPQHAHGPHGGAAPARLLQDEPLPEAGSKGQAAPPLPSKSTRCIP